MVTQIDLISTPPTPADPPAEFEKKAAQAWSDLARNVPQMNLQATELEVIGANAVQAAGEAALDSDLALGYKNEANQSRIAAQTAESQAETAREDAVAARVGAEAARDAAAQSAADAENRVPMIGATGAALLPEGVDAQRPGEGVIPAGAAVMRGSTQAAGDYLVEFWNRTAAAWHALASRSWVTQAINAAKTAIENWVNGLIGFAIIYPNGGTAAAPANVAINSRYAMENPFPGKHVICVAQVLYDGKWGETGWLFLTGEGGGGRGVKASMLGIESIVVQTGRVHLLTGNSDSGGAHVVTSPWAAPLQARVLVWKVRGAV